MNEVIIAGFLASGLGLVLAVAIENSTWYKRSTSKDLPPYLTDPHAESNS